jgi:hypothetical protein
MILRNSRFGSPSDYGPSTINIVQERRRSCRSRIRADDKPSPTEIGAAFTGNPRSSNDDNALEATGLSMPTSLRKLIQMKRL